MEEQFVDLSGGEIGMFSIPALTEEEIERILDILFGLEEKDGDSESVQVPESGSIA